MRRVWKIPVTQRLLALIGVESGALCNLQRLPRYPKSEKQDSVEYTQVVARDGRCRHTGQEVLVVWQVSGIADPTLRPTAGWSASRQSRGM
jgi:hypothetical protein